MPSSSGPSGDPAFTAVHIMSGPMKMTAGNARDGSDFHPSRAAAISTTAAANGNNKIFVDAAAAARIPMLIAARCIPVVSTMSSIV